MKLKTLFCTGNKKDFLKTAWLVTNLHTGQEEMCRSVLRVQQIVLANAENGAPSKVTTFVEQKEEIVKVENASNYSIS